MFDSFSPVSFSHFAHRSYSVYSFCIDFSGTRIGQASECFVYWKDPMTNDTWGLNFTSPIDAKQFRECCVSQSVQWWMLKLIFPLFFDARFVTIFFSTLTFPLRLFTILFIVSLIFDFDTWKNIRQTRTNTKMHQKLNMKISNFSIYSWMISLFFSWLG